MFDISSALRKLLVSEADRLNLLHRVGSYLRGKRPGKLRLPAYFPPEVRALRELSKRQLANVVYWVKPDTSVTHRSPKSMEDFAKQVIPGGIWNRQSHCDSHMANRARCHRLSKTKMPRHARTLWPSTPSVSELLEMSRRGRSVRGLEPTPSWTVPNCLTRSQVSDDIRLASRIVSQQIVGIRSAVKVQEEFLPYFRYRHGFLILTVRYKIPSGLVRFLLSQWIRFPHNLWIVENRRFRSYLKCHSALEFGVDRWVTPPIPAPRGRRVEPPMESMESSPRGLSGTPVMIATLDVATIAAEMGVEFAELYASLPP